MDSILVFLSGTSGSGKNTIINGVIENNKNCKFLVSNTTREKRPSDKRVGQYHFISKKQFEDKIAAGEILEYDSYNGNYYGLGVDEVLKYIGTGKILLKDLTIKGVLNSKEVLRGKIKQVNVFVTQKKKTLKARLIARGENKENIKNRLKLYNAEQKMSKFCDYIIVNELIPQSVAIAESIINTEYNNLPIFTNVSTERVSAKRIDKVAAKLRKGKVLKPIKVAAINKRIYILEGLNTYLASLQEGVNIPKLFVNKPEKISADANNDEWIKIVENYRK